MSVTINASTTSGLVMTSDLSGVLTFQQAGVSLPNGGVAPAFSAYANTTQNLTTTTSTLVNFGAKEYDTATCYDTATGKFTPTVAGYYQVNAGINANTTVTRISLKIYKNGTMAKNPTDVIATTVNSVEANALIYCNGTTDYIQIYTLFTGVSPQIYGGSAATDVAFTYFQACLVRGT